MEPACALLPVRSHAQRRSTTVRRAPRDCVWRGSTLPEKAVPGAALAFAERHAHEVRSKGLRGALLMHLFNLWDNGMLPLAALEACMRVVDSGAAGPAAAAGAQAGSA